ncbi:MAG: hypothetical protein ACT4O2_15105 [Beijerinckiaceae bacterium]
MDKPDIVAKNFLQMREAFLRGGGVERLAFFDERADPKGAGAFVYRAPAPRPSSQGECAEPFLNATAYL